MSTNVRPSMYHHRQTIQIRESIQEVARSEITGPPNRVTRGRDTEHRHPHTCNSKNTIKVKQLHGSLRQRNNCETRKDNNTYMQRSR